MKKLFIAILLTLASTALLAHEHGKSCDMAKDGKAISLSGKVACAGTEDCTFQTADTKYNVCEKSKADVKKLAADGSTVNVKGKLITCEGKEKLLIETVGE